jgi:hypothetical protein
MDLANTITSSVVLQTALDAETREHAALQSAARAVYDALETQEGSSQVVPFGAALLPSMAVCVCEYTM